MPDNDPNVNQDLPAVRADSPKAEEKARLPETPEERLKRRLKETEAESDDARSERRAAELQRHFDAHMENVKAAHFLHPAPFNSKHRPWESLTYQEQLNWNERSKVLQKAAMAFHLAVRRTFAEHQHEDAHLARVRKTKQEAA